MSLTNVSAAKLSVLRAVNVIEKTIAFLVLLYHRHNFFKKISPQKVQPALQIVYL